MRRLVMAIGLLGTLVFGLAFALSLLSPVRVEQAAREALRLEINRRVSDPVSDRVSDLSNAGISSAAQRARRATDRELEAAQRALALEIPQKVAGVMARMLDADCPCRKRMVEAAAESQKHRIASLSDARERLDGLIETAYASVAGRLLREARIVTASNAAAFALLAAVAWRRRGAALQLVLPAFVLAGAVALTSALYLFNQDWLHTLVFGDYVGLAYVGYLGLAIAFLADVAFNRARVTSGLVNAALQAAGSTLKAVPC